MVGAVFRPKDLAKGHKSLIENSLRDTNPDKDGVIDLLNSWEGTTSEEKLKEMLGQERAESLLDRITKKNDEEQKKNNL